MEVTKYNLANIPYDIIRLIVHMEKPESIDHLRLVSPHKAMNFRSN